MTVDFTDVDGNKTTVEYYSYDTNYYAAVTDRKTYLINKMTAKELFQAFETVDQFIVESGKCSTVQLGAIQFIGQCYSRGT